MSEFEVGWDPISLWKQSPGYLRLYVCFLFVFLMLIAIRTFRIGWQLRMWSRESFTHVPKLSESADRNLSNSQFARFKYESFAYSCRIRSVRSWTTFSLLLTTFIFFLCATDVCAAIVTYKPSGGCTAGGYSEFLCPIAFGLVVCLMIGVVHHFLQSTFDRQRLQREYSLARQRTPM